jgi:hypothetical protein
MGRYTKRSTLLVMLWVLHPSQAMAGTTSITAPVPVRSNVESSAPPPGTVNNASAPPPEGGTLTPVNTTSPSTSTPFLQSFPSGDGREAQSSNQAGGQGANATPAREGNIQVDVPPPACTQGSVESFFRSTPPQAPAGNATQNRDAMPRKHSSSNKDSSAVGGLGKFLWHVLDNVGVPLPVGNQADLDPSLTPINGNSAPVSSSNSSESFPFPENHENAAAQASQAIPQKIPQSELEGTQFDSAHDTATP